MNCYCCEHGDVKPQDIPDSVFQGRISQTWIPEIKALWMELASELLSVPDGEFIDPQVYDEICKKLKEVNKRSVDIFLDIYPCLFGKIGILPPKNICERIMSFARAKYGEPGTTQVTVSQFQADISAFVSKIKDREFTDSIRHLFADKVDSANDGLIVVSIDDIVKLSRTDISKLVNDESQSLVSIAGTLNEMIIATGLSNAGIPEDKIERTGTKGDGDVRLLGPGSDQIFLEIKSYAARERLLRGLNDIGHRYKVGVGFFTDATEFNAERTNDFLETGALAIYMPSPTYAKLPVEVRDRVNSRNTPFYRTLETLLEDARQFCAEGVLPYAAA